MPELLKDRGKGEWKQSENLERSSGWWEQCWKMEFALGLPPLSFPGQVSELQDGLITLGGTKTFYHFTCRWIKNEGNSQRLQKGGRSVGPLKCKLSLASTPLWPLSSLHISTCLLFLHLCHCSPSFCTITIPLCRIKPWSLCTKYSYMHNNPVTLELWKWHPSHQFCVRLFTEPTIFLLLGGIRLSLLFLRNWAGNFSSSWGN